ncbi:MAG: hypothetical protein IJQ56_04185, partial [Synergistaceae bacterium]|nr:hypothetical protein [Synergistaceae bacterium]
MKMQSVVFSYVITAYIFEKRSMTLAKKQIQLAFQQSQKEVDDLHQRTKVGIETARRNGKQIGQRFGRKLVIKKKSPVQQLILKYSKHF